MGNKDYQSPEKRAERALKNLADKCSRKEYCSADIRKKLEQWELPEEEAAKVMQFLQEHHFVDDRRYARNYAEDKARFNRWGRQKIALMLRQKGIAPDLITEKSPLARRKRPLQTARQAHPLCPRQGLRLRDGAKVSHATGGRRVNRPLFRILGKLEMAEIQETILLRNYLIVPVINHSRTGYLLAKQILNI